MSEVLTPYKGNLCSREATKMISIKINNVCNMKCAFCVDRGGYDAGQTNVPAIAKAAIDLKDYRTVIVTGGEPFLNFQAVIDLLTEIRPYKDRIVLNTNGSLLTTWKVKQLKGLIDELQISIHHYNEEKNNKVYNGITPIFFSNIKRALEAKDFTVSINSTFNKAYEDAEKKTALACMVDLCVWLGADRLRVTELKKVGPEDFVSAEPFLTLDSEFAHRSDIELITHGCTKYYKDSGIDISVKRLCKYAKGKDAPAFSCCFINTEGQKKIDVDTVNTFKVIYSDGTISDDWIFNSDKM